MCDYFEMAAIERQIIRTRGHGIDRNLGSDLGRAHGDLVTDRRKHYACQARQTKSKHPDHYARQPRCVSCGRRGTLRVDWFRVRREWHAKACDCHGYSFPHRRGSGLCWENPAVRDEASAARYRYA